MGMALSCPSDFDDLDRHFEALLVRSISFEDRDVGTALRSLSFNGHDSDPTVMKSFRSGKMVFEGSLSFKGRDLGMTKFSFKTPTMDTEKKASVRSTNSKNLEKDEVPKSDNSPEQKPHSSLSEPGSRRDNAALRLQKVYKSFRTRRQLADCAVVAEQKWWKLLDFAELKRSSISFFEVEKSETAISRWSRAKHRAAKVGKGLSKDRKARKLALQHWLEAIDPRHRYGHNLQFYYVRWLHCESKQPFFFWLDIGEGKEVNLERCPRSKLQHQCIKYLGPTERKDYEVVVKNGKFMYKQSGELLDTAVGPKGVKWIFVLSTSKTLYIGQKKKGTFQHSSFLAGGATLSAGSLVIEKGVLKAVWPHSGHYLPTEENFEEFMFYLLEHNVDLNDVKKSPTEEEEDAFTNNSNGSCIWSSQNPKHSDTTNAQEDIDSREYDSNAAGCPKRPRSRLSERLRPNLHRLEIPRNHNVFDIFKTDCLPPSCRNQSPDSDSDSSSEDGYETAEESFLTEEDFMFPKVNLFNESEGEEDEEPVPRQKIMERIDSHKLMKSYQLAQQLSSKWTTGAGPRIGCMRDYPSELQFRILEYANLSPRSIPSSANASPHTTSRFSPMVTPPSVGKSAFSLQQT